MKKGTIISRLPHLRRHPQQDVQVPSHIETIQGNGFSWTDILNPTRAEIDKLGQMYDFNTLNLDDSISKIQLAKIDNYDDHSFIILHFPPMIIKKGMPRFSQLSVFIGKDFLVTIHNGDLKPLVDMFLQCKENQQRRVELLSKSPGFLLHKIIDALVDDLLHTLRRIVANLDEIEDDVFDENKSTPKKISLLRREITILRRIVNPLRKIVLETSKSTQRFSSPDDDLVIHFDDVIDHIDKVVETLDEAKETMEIYKDTDFMLSTEKSNKILATLTIIFTLSIPATVIGAMYGMNVNLPGGIETGAWLFLGEYTTFIVMLILSIIPSILMFLWFYRREWLVD
ncbi:magnesium transporter CorA family protein [Candidatus Nitrosotenuis uzonensis]|uniref:Mg2 transporter protein CorA family protein n=1 Tax=Candidatus Nitrosotenuis uzonensis TaxID=1407055 RepID=A0A812EZW1_9ARCH|nr:magnesium transporter CorA family protein [Candidatus Nitrosotenuis uzonensis]MCA2003158.1 magnesium transporter CorA family protein [Candidatus Nitrosotenuis sp.]CAE6493718.1 Mg2 transporter protein CorA family protein [Candidatus Nitrosotenuis uzonensis]